MTDKEIIEITNRVFEEDFEIPVEKIVPEARIFEDLGLDSLDIVDLVVALQKSFKVRIQDDEKVRSIRTLQDIYTFIKEKRTEMGL